jgi:hypothetical protein
MRPVADEAIAFQLLLGALAGFQLSPKLVEIQIRPTLVAAMIAPLVEQATEVQLAVGAPVKFQLTPAFVDA